MSSSNDSLELVKGLFLWKLGNYLSTYVFVLKVVSTSWLLTFSSSFDRVEDQRIKSFQDFSVVLSFGGPWNHVPHPFTLGIGKRLFCCFLDRFSFFVSFFVG